MRKAAAAAAGGDAVVADGDQVLFPRHPSRPLDRVLGRVVSLDRRAKTATLRAFTDDVERAVPLAEVAPFVYAGSLDELHDLSRLPDSHEAAVLFAVQQRFRAHRVYSMVGPTLLLVNPFQWLREAEDGRPPGAPHPATIADAALAAAGPRAVVVITGQSGAGKTESAKMVVRRIAEHGASAKTNARVLACLNAVDPLLETFGNAATLHNDNSSRFAKFLDMSISPTTGCVDGCRVECYLLEVARVVRRNPHEGNFHIFHLLFAPDALSHAERTELDLWDPLLFQGMCHSTRAADTRHCPFTMSQVRAAMQEVGLDADAQRGVLRVLAAILHLSNVEFTAADAHSPATPISASGCLATAARLLGFAADTTRASDAGDEAAGADALGAALTSVSFVVGGKTQTRRLAKAAADAARDTLARSLYDGVFQLLLHFVNKALVAAAAAAPATGAAAASTAPPSAAHFQNGPAASRSVGVLDIFGFETIDPSEGINDLEQLLINYTNEVVQGLYDDSVFSALELEAEAEGVTLPPIGGASSCEMSAAAAPTPTGTTTGLHAEDSALVAAAVAGLSDEERRKRCLRVMLEKPHGILNVIADEAALGQQASGGPAEAAANLTNKILALHKSFPDVLRRDKLKRNVFRLQHYCDVVKYTVDSFAAKSRMQTGGAGILRNSSDVFVTTLLEHHQRATHLGGGGGGGSSSRGPGSFAARGNGSPLVAGGGGGAAPPRAASSLVALFREQLQRLLDILSGSSLHWIRCVKPNMSRTPLLLNPELVLQQLRTSGVLHTLQLTGHGFCIREPFHALAPTLAAALVLPPSIGGGGAPFPSDLLARGAFRELAHFAIARVPCCRDGAVLLGATRAFTTPLTFRELHALAARHHALCALTIQRAGRGSSARVALSRALITAREERLALARAERIDTERPQREELERRRRAALGANARERAALLPVLHEHATLCITQTATRFDRAVARVVAEVGRFSNEIAAASAAASAKEVAHREYHRHSANFRRELLAQAAGERERREAQSKLQRQQTRDRQQHRNAAHAEELARAEKEQRMTKVYLEARALQLRAETRVLAEQRERQEKRAQERQRQQVAQHLSLAKRRLNAQALSQQRDAAIGRSRVEPAAMPSSAERGPLQRGAASARAAPAAANLTAAALTIDDAQWAARRELWALLEGAVEDGQRDAAAKARTSAVATRL